MPWAPDYATTAELKAYVRVSDAVDDSEIGFALAAASRSIDQFTNRQFGVVAAAEARVYTACWDRHRSRYIVDIDDVMSTTGMAVAADDDDNGVFDDVTWTLNAEDGFYLFPPNAPDVARPWTRIIFRLDADAPPTDENAVQVTALFGWTSVPTAIKQATLLQANRILKRRDAAFGVAGSPEIGSELRLLDRLDPDVAVSIRPYQRWWGSV